MLTALSPPNPRTISTQTSALWTHDHSHITKVIPNLQLKRKNVRSVLPSNTLTFYGANASRAIRMTRKSPPPTKRVVSLMKPNAQ